MECVYESEFGRAGGSRGSPGGDSGEAVTTVLGRNDFSPSFRAPSFSAREGRLDGFCVMDVRVFLSMSWLLRRICMFSCLVASDMFVNRVHSYTLVCVSIHLSLFFSCVFPYTFSPTSISLPIMTCFIHTVIASYRIVLVLVFFI